MKLIPVLFYFVIFYLLYRFFKSLIFKNIPTENSDHLEKRFSRKVESSDLIQDPNCRVFFPKKDGIPLKYKGDTILFCSEECMKDFINKNNQS